MSLIKREATYRGYAVDSGVSKTKNGFPQFILACQAVEVFDEDEQAWVDLAASEDVDITAYQCLFGGSGEATLSAQQVMKIFGWAGKSFSELAALDVSQIAFQFRVENHEYDNMTSLQVGWIDVADAIPGRQVRKLDAAEVKDLDAEFSTGLKGLGGTTVNKAPVKPKTAKPMPGIVTDTRKPTPPMTDATVKDAFDKAMEVDADNIGAIVEEEEAAEAKEIAATKKAEVIAAAKAEKAAKKAAKAAKKKGPPPPPANVSKPEKVEAEDKPEISGCTKDEAWNQTIDHKSPAVDDDGFLKVWTQCVKDQMTTSEVADEDDLTGVDWAAIRERISGEVCVPF